MKLESLMGTKSRICLLRKLCEAKDRDFTISELAEEVGIDKSLVSRLVADFAKHRIVSIRERGNLKLCQINRSNGTYKLLNEIFMSERKLARGRFSW